MFRNSVTGFVVSGAVLILACYTNSHSARAQEVGHSSMTILDEPPFECGYGEDDFADRQAANNHRDDPVGEYAVLIILVNFEDDPDCDDLTCEGCDQPAEFVYGHPPGGSGEYGEVVTTAEQAYGIFFGNDDLDPDYVSVSDYYDEVSYGRMQLTGGEMDLIHAAAGYYTLDIDLCSCAEDSCSPSDGVWSEIRTHGIAAAEAGGWDVHLDDYDRLVSNTYEGVIFAFPAYPGWGVLGYSSGTFTFQSTLSLGVSVHEQGHMIGLGHAQSWDCGDQVWGSDDTCTYSVFGNKFDVMGSGHRGHFNAAFKYKLGWLCDGFCDTHVLTLTDVSDNGTYYLTPLEVAGDGEVDDYAITLRIPRGEDYYYYFEFRQLLGFDGVMYDDYRRDYPSHFPENGFDGLMVNRFTSSWSYFEKPASQLLDMTPGSQTFFDAVLLVGETYTDPLAGFEITPVSITNEHTEDAILEVEVRFSTIEVDAGPDQTIPFGEQVTLGPVVISGGTPPYTCEWIPPEGLDDPTACTSVIAGPAETTTYMLVVDDSAPDPAFGVDVVTVVVDYDDCNDNGIPDQCDIDCSGGGEYVCTMEGCGGSLDCQPNGTPDECDIADGTSIDELPPGGDGIPDECQEDCNGNGILDEYDIADGTSGDCNDNDIPDECDIAADTSDDDLPEGGDGIPDECQDFLHVPDEEYTTIQSAIDDATDWDVILVADGTYTGEGNRNLDFAGKGITVRSVNGPENCIIDCENDGRAFTFDEEEGRFAIVDGFTIINGSADQGGAIYLGNEVQATIQNCIITGNSAQKGGGIFCISGKPTIRNCKITGNTASVNGGGFTGTTRLSGLGDPLPPYPSIRNCTVTGNLAQHGGGLAIDRASYTIWQISNCTIAGNRATSSGGGVYCFGSSSALQNCILWGDQAPTGPEIALVAPAFGTITLTVDYSDVEGGEAEVDDDPDDNAILVWGEGNIDADPLFFDPVNQDYHLQAVSPCIDAGDDAVVSSGDVDMDGDPRILDGDGDREAIVDMGADEFVFCFKIVSSDPPDGAIDARQPHGPFTGHPQQGWQEIEFTYVGLSGLPRQEDFTVTQEGGEGTTPTVTDVQIVNNNTALVILSHPIAVGAWTTITHNCSGTRVRLGYLPGDVNGDAVSDLRDTKALVAYLNDVNPPVVIRSLPIWSTDINRDGQTDYADVSRLIELLRGMGAYAPGYDGMSLP